MFSHNGKISKRQIQRMLVLPLFANCVFVLPYLAALLFGQQVMTGLLIFFLLSCLYIFYMYKIGGWKDMEHAQTEGSVQKCILFLSVIRQLLRMVFSVILAIEVLGEAQVPFMKGTDTHHLTNLWVVVPLLLVALYAAGHSLEKVGRLHEMIFWVLFVPFIIMILFGLFEVDYDIFVPHLFLSGEANGIEEKMSFGRILLYAYALLTFVVPVENYPYLRSHFNGKKTNSILLAQIFTVALAVLISLFVLGIYGLNGAAKEEMVAIAIMRYIRFPFGVLERFDVLMVWFFMTGCFVLICNHLYQGGILICRLFGRRESQQSYGRVKVVGMAVLLVITICLVWILPNYPVTLLLFLLYGVCIDVPLSLVFPLIWEETYRE